MPVTKKSVKVNGFITSDGVTSVYNAGGGEWEAQIGGPGIVYTHPDYGKLRVCPDLWARLAETATGRPTTLNHSTNENGVVTKMWVDDDGRPWARWIVNEDTNTMMGSEEWAGGISPSITPLKIIKDDTAVADGIVTEGKFDSLGIGDGSMTPACSLGVCNPTKVDGMADDADEGAGGDADEEHKKQLAEVKATATEDGYKVIETLLTKQQERFDVQIKELQEKFDAVTESEESLKTWKEKEETATKEALIAKLPKETLDTLGVKPEDKSLDELRELVGIIKAVAGPESDDDTGDEQTGGDGKPKKPKTNANEALPPEGSDEDAKDKEAREYNKKVKAKYAKSALLKHD